MARHLIQNSTTGATKIVGDSALDFFPGWVVRDTLEDGQPPFLFYTGGESDLRYVNVSELSDPESPPSVALKAAFDAWGEDLDTGDPITSISPPAILPRVVINTVGGAPILDTTTYINATVTINGEQPYSGTTQIRGRGNTTWALNKKPYRLKLTTAASLLGMPAERDWVLLANAVDTSFIRTSVAMELGNRSPGLDWTPRFRYVEVELNGAYIGLYQLGEQVEISTPDRINVTKASGTTGLALTGAYSLEIDNYEPLFVTTHDALPIKMDDPDGTTAAQKTYIQNWLNSFETALYASDWLDPATGYARFIDRDSFIDWYLVEETLRNGDSNGFSSIKMVKTRDTDTTPGKLVLGPLWDFDRSLTGSATGFYTIVPVAGNEAKYPGMTWIARMLQDPAFFAALVARWNQLKADITTGDTVYAIIDRLTDRLTYAIGRDKRTWNYTVDTPALAAAIATFLRTRIAWLSTQWVIDTTAPSVPTGLTATAGNGQVALSWTASTDDTAVAKYRVRRGATVVGEPTTTSFTETGLTNGTPVTYTVSALDAAGNESAQTAGATATPSGATDTTAPTVPTGLTATPGDAQVVLTWTASTDTIGVTGYKVRRGGTLIGSPTGTTYTDTGLTNGTAYSYTVSAVDAAANESAQTSAVSATPVMVNFVSDSFTGADDTPVDSHVGETGATWTKAQGAGVHVITSNQVRSTLSSQAIYLASGTPASADYEVEADLVFRTVPSSQQIGVVARGVAGNGYAFQYLGSTGWQLIRLDNGSPISLGTAAATVSTGQTRRIKLRVAGTAITGYVDGVQVLTATDATYSAAGKVGYKANNAVTTTQIVLDNIAAHPIGA